MTREAARVLRPGGVFAIIEHNPLNPATRLIVRRLPMDRNAILLGARETRRLLRAAGFANSVPLISSISPKGCSACFRRWK